MWGLYRRDARVHVSMTQRAGCFGPQLENTRLGRGSCEKGKSRVFDCTQVISLHLRHVMVESLGSGTHLFGLPPGSAPSLTVN